MTSPGQQPDARPSPGTHRGQPDAGGAGILSGADRIAHPAVIILAYAVPFVLLLALLMLDIPFGRPGVIVYRYSPVVLSRLAAAAVLCLLMIVPAIVTVRLIAKDSFGPVAGWIAVAICALLLGVWTFFAPPFAASQHYFNGLSPSHDGAFATEARRIDSLSAYLQNFPNLLHRTPEQLKGTRVLSNPPGTTMLAYAVNDLLDGRTDAAQWILDWHGMDLDATEPQGAICASIVAFSWALLAIWIASAAALYALARLWFDPLPAVTVTLICFFNPSSVCFAPGKDPAQLFTIALLIWGWLASCKGRRLLPAFIAGMALAIGLAVSLVHVWIAIILVVASLWSHRDNLTRLVLRVFLPATGGFVAACILAVTIWGWNLPAMLPAVAASFNRMQAAIGYQPWHWIVVQFPMFALFAGGGLWILLGMLTGPRISDPPARMGRALLVVTAPVMAYTSLHTSLETPRLWLAFVPLLVIGAAAQVPLFSSRDPVSRRRLLLIAALQIVATALAWSLFDVRESEMRLITGRMFE